MQKITDAWKKFMDKSDIWDEDYQNKIENFIIWLDESGFYGGGSPAQDYNNAWGVNIYYVNINILKLYFIEDMIKIERPQKCEFGTTRFQEHEGINEKLDNEIYWNKEIKINKDEEIERLKQWILKAKNLILNHLTSKIKINSLELENFRLFEKEEIQFKTDFTVLIGDNGSAKTSILEAVAISLSEFLRKFDIIKRLDLRIITKNDVRLKGHVLGDEYRFEEQYPVSVGGSYNFGTNEYKWAKLKFSTSVGGLTSSVIGNFTILF